MNIPNYENSMAKHSEERKKEYENKGVSITHGMTQHSNKLINPFEEKRRPDSRTELKAPNKANDLNENLQMTSGNMPPKDNLNPFSMQQDALLNQNLNNFPLQNPFGQFPCPPMFWPPKLFPLPAANFQANLSPHLNPLLPPFYPPANNLSMLGNLNNPFNFQHLLPEQHQFLQNDLKLQAQSHFKQLLNQQYASGQFLMNSKYISDLEAKKREIGDTIHITHPHGSISDTNDKQQPVQIHDSDVSSMCSEDTWDSRNGDKKPTSETIDADFKDLIDKMKPMSDSEDDKDEGAKKV